MTLHYQNHIFQGTRQSQYHNHHCFPKLLNIDIYITKSIEVKAHRYHWLRPCNQETRFDCVRSAEKFCPSLTGTFKLRQIDTILVFVSPPPQKINSYKKTITPIFWETVVWFQLSVEINIGRWGMATIDETRPPLKETFKLLNSSCAPTIISITALKLMADATSTNQGYLQPHKNVLMFS